eukprot:maker-scaffold57_size444674-snap-gene-2.14 protein:Tk04369 transcript:maker-scaffold57_size444674-snap-gene-2.14-mRNA-1 annotation:"helicase conserved c-terminal domain containing protein"
MNPSAPPTLGTDSSAGGLVHRPTHQSALRFTVEHSGSTTRTQLLQEESGDSDRDALDTVRGRAMAQTNGRRRKRSSFGRGSFRRRWSGSRNRDKSPEIVWAGILATHGYVNKCYCPGNSDFDTKLEKRMWELRTDAVKHFEVVLKPRPHREGIPSVDVLKQLFPRLSMKELTDMTTENYQAQMDKAKAKESSRRDDFGKKDEIKADEKEAPTQDKGKSPDEDSSKDERPPQGQQDDKANGNGTLRQKRQADDKPPPRDDKGRNDTSRDQNSSKEGEEIQKPSNTEGGTRDSKPSKDSEDTEDKPTEAKVGTNGTKPSRDVDETTGAEGGNRGPEPNKGTGENGNGTNITERTNGSEPSRGPDENGPAKNENGPAKNENGPAKNENGPAKNENGPAKNENGTSGSKPVRGPEGNLNGPNKTENVTSGSKPVKGPEGNMNGPNKTENPTSGSKPTRDPKENVNEAPKKEDGASGSKPAKDPREEREKEPANAKGEQTGSKAIKDPQQNSGDANQVKPPPAKPTDGAKPNERNPAKDAPKQLGSGANPSQTTTRQRSEPKPIQKDTAMPIAPIGVQPVAGSLTRAVMCSCPAKTKIMKDITFKNVEADPKLEDTTSAEFAAFKEVQEAKLNEEMIKDPKLKSEGFAGINILSVTLGSSGSSSRKKRATGDVDANTQSQCTGDCDPNDVDQAVDDTDGVSSTSPATDQTAPQSTIFLAANPCSKANLAAMAPPPPAYLINDLLATATVESSFFMHLTCSRSDPGGEYRQYQEPAGSGDDGPDNKLGVLCNDGAFAETVWPDESLCQVVQTCSSIPNPPNSTLLLPLEATEIPSGASAFFSCADPEAILDDGSGLSMFEVKCQGTQLVYTDGTGSVVNFDPATNFPTCLSQCTYLFNGNKQYKARVGNDSAVVIRAGETLPFDCPFGLYVETMAYDVATVDGLCQSDGKFRIESRKCFLVPCTQEDINSIPPPDNAGALVTTTSGEIMPAESIYFKCSDPLKHEAAGFPATNYPDCVTGCVSFPVLDDFKPKSRLPLLPGNTVEYECDRNNFIPHTDVDLVMGCQVNGTLTPTTEIPQCVPKETCRQKHYPNHESYSVFDETKVSFRKNEVLHMACTAEELVAETPNFTQSTFGIKCIQNNVTNEFMFEQDLQWPRCIPKKCIKFFAKHTKRNGTCQCEFDECSEYLFDRIERQCPQASTGPFCGLEPYQDWSDEIAGLFEDPPPEDVPTESEIGELAVMESELDLTVAEMEALVSASSDANDSSGSRRKRSNVPMFCSELKEKLTKIKDMVTLGVKNLVFPTSEIIRQCEYIHRSQVTKGDCEEEGVDLAPGLTSLRTEVKTSKTTIQELVKANQAAEQQWAAAVAEAKAKADNHTQVLLEQVKMNNGMNATTEGSKPEDTTQMVKTQLVTKTTSTTTTKSPPKTTPVKLPKDAKDAPSKDTENIKDDKDGDEKRGDGNNGNGNDSDSGNRDWKEERDDDKSMKLARRKRSAFLQDLVRRKRALRFRCNTQMIYGINLKDMHHPGGIQADKCCCPNFRGEYFKCVATIDSPWNTAFGMVRSAFYKEKFKMVQQEVQYLIRNTNFSHIAMADEMSMFNFTGFNNTGNKVGVFFRVILKTPHWDNHARIEKSFIAAARVYANQSDDEEHVLGNIVQGKFERNEYVLESGKKGIQCVKSEFEDLEGSGSGDDSDGESGALMEDTGNGWILFVMIPLAIVVFLGLIIYVVFLMSRSGSTEPIIQDSLQVIPMEEHVTRSRRPSKQYGQVEWPPNYDVPPLSAHIRIEALQRV